MAKYSLVDPMNGAEYSANAGDYWNYSPNKILRNKYDDKLWLKDNATGKIVKKTVRKKDLKDSIYESIKKGLAVARKRKSIGRGKLFKLASYAYADEYYINSKGMIIQSGFWMSKKKMPDFSGKWLFDGLVDRYGRKVMSWSEALKKSGKIDISKYYIADIDHGTSRVWGKKMKYFYPVDRRGLRK